MRAQSVTRGKCALMDFYIFLLIFQHKWMFLSTMQTLPNQIPLGPAEMISLLSFSVEWGFYSCWISTWQDQIKKVSVPKEFGLYLNNIVCEYEVNLFDNDKVIKAIQNFHPQW